MRFLSLNTVKVEGKERENLFSALLKLAETDDDFCGKNGDGSLWDEAKENGFSSNADYCISLLKNKEESDETLINEFVDKWINSDGYYCDCVTNTVCDKNGKAEFIALAFTSKD